MTNYTVRIELHDADEEDYENLHAAMEGEGFVRWIQSEKGTQLRLPTAEYNLVGSSLDKKAVLNTAVAAAQRVKPRPKPWVLVTQSAGRTWDGLQEWE